MQENSNFLSMPKLFAGCASFFVLSTSLAHLNSNPPTRAFNRNLMEYCSPLWAGTPASNLAHLDAVETKAFKIIGISHDEVESMCISLFHHRQVGGLFVFFSIFFWSCTTICPLCALSPPPHPMLMQSAHGPPETPFL